MKVLLATGLFPPEIGGPATHAKILAEELPKRGVAVSVLPFSRVRHLPKGIAHVAYLWELLRGAWGADIVYALDAYSVGIPAAVAAMLLRKRFILRVPGDTVWELYVQRKSYVSLEEFQHMSVGLITNVCKKLEWWTASRAEKILVPSKYLKKIVGQWGADAKKIYVVYSSYTNDFVPGHVETLRGILRFEGKLIVSTGRLVPWKGFMTLVEIMPSLVKKFSNIKLFIVGSGPDMPMLEKKITELGMNKHISLAGRVEHASLMRYIQMSDVFVLNTGYEGFSHQLLEVMNIGVPIVTTRVGGNPELIEHKRNGVLVSYENKKQLQEAIESVLKDKVLAEKLVIEGKKTVVEYTDKKMLDALVPLLQKP